MRKGLLRRIEKLEQGSPRTSQFQAKLRAWARRWGVPEEGFLRAAESYAQELRGELEEDGTVTWLIFLLLRDIAGQLATGAGLEGGN